MARKKKKKQPWYMAPFRAFSHVSDTTRRSVLGIFFAALALLLLLAAAGSAGPLGTSVYNGLSYLLGVGYFLLPALLFVLVGVLFTSLQPDIALVKTVGGILFLISGFGLIEMLAEDRGGLVGELIASPLLYLFEFAASLLILIAVLITAAIMLADGTAFGGIRIPFLHRKEREEEEYGEDAEEAARAAEATLEDAEEGVDEPEEEAEEEYEEEDEYEEDEAEEEEAPQGASSAPSGLSMGTITSVAYEPPPLSLLSKDKGKPGSGDIKANANLIKRTLSNFGIEVELDEISVGPTVTRYAIKPAEGVRLNRIVSLQNNLELALAASPVRIEAPIPGRSLVGIEVPNTSKSKIGLASLLGADEFQQSGTPLLTALGKSISGSMHFADVSKMPHLLIAGATGSGKSVMIHSLLTSLLYRNSPEHLRFIMVDPKRVELTLYKNTPHLLTPVITDAKKAILALKWAGQEMSRRYDILEEEAVRDISSYHQKVLAPAREKLAKAAKKQGKDENDIDEEQLPEPMPYIVIVIDELADLMQTYPREFEAAVVRLAQMSRAVGIHLILSTQRPSVNVITGLIKANIPARIALQVSSQVDSRTILDAAGAERLLGAGDMLYSSGEMAKPQRLQSPFIPEDEVKSVVKWLSGRYEQEMPEGGLSFSNNQEEDDDENGASGGSSIFDSVDDPDAEDEDELFEEARKIVVHSGKASTSYLQRRLRVGYSRAARLIDTLEDRGIIGPAEGSKPREVYEKPDADGGEGASDDDSEEQ